MSDKEKLARELIDRMNKLLTTAHQAGIFFSFVTSRNKGMVVWSDENFFEFHTHDGANINI